MMNSDTKEWLWHRKYGHLGEQNLQKLVKNELASVKCVLVASITAALSRKARAYYRTTGVSSLRCVWQDGSQGGAEYFLTVYPLKTKGQVFERFEQCICLCSKRRERKTGLKSKEVRPPGVWRHYKGLQAL